MVQTLGVGAEETAISAAAVRRTEGCADGAGKLRRRVLCSRTAQCCMQPQEGEEFPRNSPHSSIPVSPRRRAVSSSLYRCAEGAAMLVVSRRPQQVDSPPAILVVEMLSSIVILRNKAHDIFLEARGGSEGDFCWWLGLASCESKGRGCSNWFVG